MRLGAAILIERNFTLAHITPGEIPVRLSMPDKAELCHFLWRSRYAGMVFMGGRSISATSSTSR